MKTLCIIPCGRKKIWDKYPDSGPTRAKDVYIGSFAKKCREYAEKFYPGHWCILSAYHGFLFPDDIVPGPYNVTFNDKQTNPITIEKLTSQASRKRIDEFDRIIVIGGKNYAEIACAIFPSISIYLPLKDCKGMGYMNGEMTKAIRTGVPL